MMISKTPYSCIAGWLLAMLGGFISLEGNDFEILSGAPYFMLTGLALIASGALIGRGYARGIWLFLITWITSLAWSLWEVGFEPLRGVPRIMMPLIILVLLCIPRVKLGLEYSPGDALRHSR